MEHVAFYAVLTVLAGAAVCPLYGRDYPGIRLAVAVLFAATIAILAFNWIDVAHWPGRALYSSLALLLLTAAIAGLSLAANAACRIWFALAASALFLETGVRAFPLYDTFAANPGIRFFWPDWVAQLNNFGHRDRDFVTTKPAGHFRILLLGDSFTEGAGLSREQTFGQLLERPGIEVYNLSHAGMNTREEADVLLRDGPKLDPDMIVLNYVFNDAETHPLERAYQELPGWFVGAQRVLTHRLGSYAAYAVLWQVQQLLPTNYASIVDFYSTQHQSAAGWAGVTTGLADIERWAKPRNVAMIGIIWPIFLDSWPADGGGLNAKIVAAMRERGFRVLDLSTVFGPNYGAYRISGYDAHPNAEANAKAALVLKSFLDLPR